MNFKKYFKTFIVGNGYYKLRICLQFATTFFRKLTYENHMLELANTSFMHA